MSCLVTAGVVRAAIMGGLGVFAVQIGRRQVGLNSLLFVAALIALADPHVLWDVGFQLSFMATLGLILYADPLSGWFTGLAGRRLPPSTAQRLSRPVGEYFLFTRAAGLSDRGRGRRGTADRAAIRGGTLPARSCYFRNGTLLIEFEGHKELVES